MKIGVIGGGSIGLLYAYYLNQHHEVHLYVRRKRQKEKLESDGLILEKRSKIYRTKVEVHLIEEWKGNEDLSIICVKQYHLPELIKNSHFSSQKPLLFLQNGMGHIKYMENLQSDSILVGSIEQGALRVKENHVVHTGEGQTKISIFKGECEQTLESLTGPLEDTFPFKQERDYKEMLLKKLVVNAIINSLTGVLKVQNGVLLENPHYFHLVNRLFNEIKEVLQLKCEAIYYENVLEVCKNTGQNRSSMLKDIEENRPTEIDAILGFLLEEAKKKQIETPLIQTLYHCIKGSELEGERL